MFPLFWEGSTEISNKSFEGVCIRRENLDFLSQPVREKRKNKIKEIIPANTKAIGQNECGPARFLAALIFTFFDDGNLGEDKRLVAKDILGLFFQIFFLLFPLFAFIESAEFCHILNFSKLIHSLQSP